MTNSEKGDGNYEQGEHLGMTDNDPINNSIDFRIMAPFEREKWDE